jgi:hypothetical protein
VTLVLDGELHGLDEGEVGSTLVSLARALPDKIEIRLAARRLHTKLFALEEQTAGGPRLTSFIGSTQPGAGGDDERVSIRSSAVEANVRVAGALDGGGEPVAAVAEWVSHLLAESKRLADATLLAWPTLDWVIAKVGYKRDFDTAHELCLKHLSERLCRRGRHATPMFDPTTLEPPATHQQLAVAGAARPWSEGFLLLDEPGLGKTVEAGLILSRELRRRRVFASSDASERRRGLVIAPRSQHDHWLEELGSKFALAAESIDGLPVLGMCSAQVAIVSPRLVATRSEEIHGFDVIVADEAQLYDDATMEGLANIRAGAELCVVCSGVPVRDEASEIVSLAALAAPSEGLDAYLDAEPFVAGDTLAHELRAVASRTRRRPLVENGTLPRREVVDRFWPLDEDEAQIYGELRRMRSDYLRRSAYATAWAFVDLEQAFLSSMQAFAAACRHERGQITRTHAQSLAPERRDASHSVLSSSSYFRRRLKAICEKLGSRLSPDAPLSKKEEELLRILGDGAGVVVFTRHHATLDRLARVLSRAFEKNNRRVERLDATLPLRERMRVVERCSASSAVLLASDEAAWGLSLQRHVTTLVNYDLPWNPQTIEERIGRLQRWGQTAVVRVFNLAARGITQDGWTMDTRVLYACRRLFNMADPYAVANDALHEIDPLELERQLAREDDVELSLLEEPSAEALSELERWLAQEPPSDWTVAAVAASPADARYRRDLIELWSRVAHGGRGLEGARGHFFERLRLALLQGQVGVLCAPDRPIGDCYTFHVAIGLRSLYETAVCEGSAEPMDEQWLIEDEEVHLWAVAPDGTLADWSELVMQRGMDEVAQDRARKIVGPDVIDWLLAKKRTLEAKELDCLPLSTWREGAPASVESKLSVAQRHANGMARTRLAALTQAWDREKSARLERLRARRAAFAARGVDEEVLAQIDARIAEAERRQAHWRHSVLGTQVFLVMQ